MERHAKVLLASLSFDHIERALNDLSLAKVVRQITFHLILLVTALIGIPFLVTEHDSSMNPCLVIILQAYTSQTNHSGVLDCLEFHLDLKIGVVATNHATELLRVLHGLVLFKFKGEGCKAMEHNCAVLTVVVQVGAHLQTVGRDVKGLLVHEVKGIGLIDLDVLGLTIEFCLFVEVKFHGLKHELRGIKLLPFDTILAPAQN